MDFSLFGESTMSPILRHFSQDKGGRGQKNARNWGFSHMCCGKARKTGLFKQVKHAVKSKRAAADPERSEGPAGATI